MLSDEGDAELETASLLDGRGRSATNSAAAAPHSRRPRFLPSPLALDAVHSPSHVAVSLASDGLSSPSPSAASSADARFNVLFRRICAVVLLQSMLVLVLIAMLSTVWNSNTDHRIGATHVHTDARNTTVAIEPTLNPNTQTAAASKLQCPSPPPPPPPAPVHPRPPMCGDPFIPRPVSLVGVPAPISPPLPARAPDGSYLPYHTSITDPILYDVYSSPPAHPLSLLHARQSLPSLPSSYFGHRYIKAHNSFPGRFNNLRMMILTLLWFGRLLNRTVVWPEHAQLIAHIDLDRLGALHPLIAEHQLPSGWNKQNRSHRMGLNEWKDVIYPSRAEYEAQPDQVAWMQSKEGGQRPSQMFVARFLHDEWGAGSGAVNDRMVLLMDVRWPNLRNLFGGFTPAMHSSLDLWAMDAFRVSPPLLAMTDRALHSFSASDIGGQLRFTAGGMPPSFDLAAAIHWRLGDYVHAHKHRHTIISVAAAVNWTKEMMERDRAAGRDTSRFSVYIATEGEPDAVLQYKRAALSLGVRAVWLWSNVNRTAVFQSLHSWKSPNHALAKDATALGIIESTMLTQPRYFLGTGRSTLTEMVLRMRSTNAAHRADALQGLRRWDRISSEPKSAGFNAAVWPPDAYEPLPAPIACLSVHMAADAPAALVSSPSSVSTAAAPPCDPPTPTVFEPYPGSKPPPHLISDDTRRMWAHAIAPAKRL